MTAEGRKRRERAGKPGACRGAWETLPSFPAAAEKLGAPAEKTAPVAEE